MLKEKNLPMKKIILHLLLVAFSSFNLYSQSEYWQQKVDTRINVLLNDSTHFLHGNIAISYQNNSQTASISSICTSTQMPTEM